ncbi:Late competence development protein ComFB [Burkholderiales bacterium JOSHI_001]|nr:Late competence development protein ComFB [Burkholderiales bacterium JOSHI_001]
MDFTSVHNHHEQSVFQAVMQASTRFPGVAGKPDLLADVACVALNRLAPRYVRHDVDLAFYLTEHERGELDKAIAHAVDQAYGFVQARQAMRARQ